MKVRLTTKGDSSVGIDGIDTELELGTDFDNEEKIWVRNNLMKCFTEIYGETVKVRFENECDLCGSELVDGTHCNNKTCPNDVNK
jgi:hypothetical protein